MKNRSSQSRPGRRAGVVGLVAMVCVALLVTLWPTPVDRDLRGLLAVAIDRMHSAGVPGWVGYNLLEFVANVLMFVPVGFFVGLLVLAAPGVTGWRAVWCGIVALAIPLALSVAVECAQLLLPERHSTLADVVANTLGGWAGVGLAAVIRRGILRRTRPSSLHESML